MRASFLEIWTARIKSAWLVLKGDAFATPYANVYHDMLYEMEKAGVIKMSDPNDYKNFNTQ